MEGRRDHVNRNEINERTHVEFQGCVLDSVRERTAK